MMAVLLTLLPFQTDNCSSSFFNLINSYLHMFLKSIFSEQRQRGVLGCQSQQDGCITTAKSL